MTLFPLKQSFTFIQAKGRVVWHVINQWLSYHPGVPEDLFKGVTGCPAMLALLVWKQDSQNKTRFQIVVKRFCPVVIFARKEFLYCFSVVKNKASENSWHLPRDALSLQKVKNPCYRLTQRSKSFCRLQPTSSDAMTGLSGHVPTSIHLWFMMLQTHLWSHTCRHSPCWKFAAR